MKSKFQIEKEENKEKEEKEKSVINQEKGKELTPIQKREIDKQQKKSLCQIRIGEFKANGFLCKIPEVQNPVLITNNHVLDETQIKLGEKINIYFTNEKFEMIKKTIVIDETRTTYTIKEFNGEEIDTTIIELKPNEDKLNDLEFMELDRDFMNEKNKKIYEKKDIYVIQYYSGEILTISTGIINKIIEKNKKDECFTLFHTCNTDYGSSGSPIILYNHKIIGVHRGFKKNEEFNRGTLLQYSVKEYKKLIYDKNDEVIMIYKINKNNNKIKVLDQQFIKNNKENYTLIVNNKIYNLCEYIKYDKYDINKNYDLLKIILKSIKNKKITDMSFIFYECKSLISVNFLTFNANNVTNMYGMFWGCTFLTTINLSYFNTKNVTNMESMFESCSNLESLDLKSFNTEKVTNMKSMFDGCSSLKSLNLSSFNTMNVTNMYAMFYGCSSLLTLDLSSFNTKNVTNMTFMFGDSNKGCSSLKTLKLSPLFNTEKIASMEGMFGNCSSLTTINLSSFNTQNVTNMYAMFYGCSSLNSLDLSSFNTQNVTTMYAMFCKCSNLTILNLLSSFNTQNVKNMEYMFSGCTSLTILDLSKFKTENVINMEKMFYECKSLISLDLRTFNTQNVINMEWMFGNCSSLTILNLSSFIADKANINNMFNGSKKLLSYDCSDKIIKMRLVIVLVFEKLQKFYIKFNVIKSKSF